MRELSSAPETAMAERERLLKVFTDDSFRSSRPNHYYPGAGDYHPSKIIASRDGWGDVLIVREIVLTFLSRHSAAFSISGDGECQQVGRQTSRQN